MSKKILIDSSNDEEIRVAVTEDGKLDDFEIESQKKNAVKGDVYLAKITRVEPSLQAAFVNYGSNRHGFLPLTEIHPDYFKIPSGDQKIFKKLSDNLIRDELDELDLSEENDNNYDEEAKHVSKNDTKLEFLNFVKKYKIQDVIKPRQIILVQINKEERGLKGSALTTFLSFAGRYCVLMPNSISRNGISRKISDIEERKKLKEILTNVSIPQKMSVIVRTAGIGKTKKEIAKDLEHLISQWNSIRETTLKSDAPNLIFEDGSIIKRTIRDLLTNDVDEVHIEGQKGFQIAKKYVKNLTPQKLKILKPYNSKDRTLFNENNIEHQINELFSLKVNLASGGSIVINTTEALVAIDVNSGKNTSERNIENTAIKTNLEASNEIARQLRLRDLGGLVVIDFIDMDDYRNNFKVEKALKTALYKDRARVQVGRISMFGLLELSRQRLRSSLFDKSFNKCHLCEGSGIILNSNSIVEQIIKLINEKAISSENSNIKVKCNSTLAETLMNNKREDLKLIEEKYNCKTFFTFDSNFTFHEPSVEIIEKISIERDAKEKKKNVKKSNLKTKKTTTKKKKTIKKSSEKKEAKSNLDEKIISKEAKKDVEEKSGWWSE